MGKRSLRIYYLRAVIRINTNTVLFSNYAAALSLTLTSKLVDESLVLMWRKNQ